MTNENYNNKKKEWKIRASKKQAIVPNYFEVYPNKVEIICGNCNHAYSRSLIINLDEPTFVCPSCGVKNWIPLKYDLK